MLPVRVGALLRVASLREVTEQHLQGLITANVAEDQDLDFKQARYGQGPKGNSELAKDVAALANHVGGLLILGVAEDSQGRATGLAPVKLDDSEKGRILQVIADRLHPMVLGVEVHDLPTATDPTVGYYLISVPRSPMAPHAIPHEVSKPYLLYPLRHGTTTHHMTETQIAARYRDRFDLARDQVGRLERLHVEARGAETFQQVALAVGLIPSVPGERPITGDGQKVSDYFTYWEHSQTKYTALRAGQLRVARRRLRSEAGYALLELHTDGSGWARTLNGQIPGQGVLIVDPAEFERTITEMLAFLGGYAAWCGAGGDCAIGAWLYGGSGVKVGWRLPGAPDLTWIPLPLPVEPAEATAAVAQLAVDKAAVGQTAYRLIRDLEQDLGLAEPSVLQSNGTFET